MKCKNCEEEFEFPTYVGYISLEWCNGEDDDCWESHTTGFEQPNYYPACPFCMQPLYRGVVDYYHYLDGTVKTNYDRPHRR